VITTIDDFLRYVRGVHQRTLRDVVALPAHAGAWRPAGGEGEQAWSVDELVAHIAALRSFFVSAYRGEGWRTAPVEVVHTPGERAAVLQASAAEASARLAGTPVAWLQRRVPTLDGPDDVVGWRILMMLVEHDVHHRSQIDAYAGLNEWAPPQLFERSYEQVQAAQRPDGRV
jgi:uncharacterized damage-inducible protein DinB